MGKLIRFWIKHRYWRISLARGNRSEMQAAEQVRRLLEDHDLDRLSSTRDLRVDSHSTPHSHPVLTLNTGYVEDDRLALAVFVHEQIHWLLSPHREKVRSAIAELQRLFPRVPDRPPKGASGRFSTYLHLIFNYLEYQALKKIFGTNSARSILEEERASHYSWIYKTVLEDWHRIRTTIRQHNLQLEDLGQKD